MMAVNTAGHGKNMEQLFLLVIDNEGKHGPNS